MSNGYLYMHIYTRTTYIYAQKCAYQMISEKGNVVEQVDDFISRLALDYFVDMSERETTEN